MALVAVGLYVSVQSRYHSFRAKHSHSLIFRTRTRDKFTVLLPTKGEEGKVRVLLSTKGEEGKVRVRLATKGEEGKVRILLRTKGEKRKVRILLRTKGLVS